MGSTPYVFTRALSSISAFIYEGVPMFVVAVVRVYSAEWECSQPHTLQFLLVSVSTAWCVLVGGTTPVTHATLMYSTLQRQMT